MSAAITFLITWLIFVIVGSLGSIIWHSDKAFSIIINLWLNNDLVYILIIGWVLSAIIILCLYSQSASKKKDEETKDEPTAGDKTKKE